MMDFQPLLQDEIVQVRPLEKIDFQGLFTHANDPTVWDQLPRRARQRHTLRGFEQFFNNLLATGTAFCIVDRHTNLPIGTTKYYLHKKLLYMGGTFLGKQYWGGQYNLAFRSLLINHAFKYCNVIHIHISENNLRNRRATKKLGFHEAFTENLDRGDEQGTFVTYRCYKGNWDCSLELVEDVATV